MAWKTGVLFAGRSFRKGGRSALNVRGEMMMEDNIACPECGRIFVPSLNQLYCSKKCSFRYYKKHGPVGYPSVTFNCAKCGRVVATDGKKDRRSRFCSPECEKRYWRHPPHEHTTSNTMFHNVSDYLSYEHRSNRKQQTE